MNNGALYLVATPIGNLGDITLRALEVLKSVDLIACEDTRHSKILLDHHGIQKALISCFDHSEKKRAPELIAKIKGGMKVALISDAGTPGIADPGYRVLQEALRQDVRIETLPGPSAFLAALTLSGLPTDRFIFEGFFPVKEGQKKQKLEELKSEERTVIFYESPHRLLKTLKVMGDVLGGAPIVVVREISKKFEEIVRGSAAKVLEHFSDKKVRGEFVILFNLKHRVTPEL